MATMEHVHEADRYSPCDACVDMVPELRAERRKYEAEQKAQALVKELTRFVNGMSREEADAFATALANDHPTLIGQVAKYVGIGVMRRAVRDPEWSPFQSYERVCPIEPYLPNTAVAHAEHDGRLDCATVIGAELMAMQSYI